MNWYKIAQLDPTETIVAAAYQDAKTGKFSPVKIMPKHH